MACTDFIQDRITITEELIAAYEDALIALATAGIQSYELDTSQSRQRVTKFDVPDINTMLDSLYNRLETLNARCSGSGVVTVRPEF